MVDFMAKNKQEKLNQQFEKIQQQRITQVKATEKLSISNSFSLATLQLVTNQKSMIKKAAKEVSKDISADLNFELNQIHVYIEGKTVSKMKEAYRQEDKVLLQL